MIEWNGASTGSGYKDNRSGDLGESPQMLFGRKRPLSPIDAALMERLQKTEGFIDVSSDMRMNTPIQELEILRDQAYSYGVNVQEIESTLAMAFAQGRASQIQTPLNVYWVILELLDKERARLDYLNLLWVRNQQGSLAPLGSLVRPHIKTGPESISHINQITSVTIFYNLKPGYPTGPPRTPFSKWRGRFFPPRSQGPRPDQAPSLSRRSKQWSSCYSSRSS